MKLLKIGDTHYNVDMIVKVVETSVKRRRDPGGPLNMGPTGKVPALTEDDFITDYSIAVHFLGGGEMVKFKDAEAREFMAKLQESSQVARQGLQ